ncbi:Lactonase, 7-bladed beta-propeller-domain-containing protein [Achaetomium macrosporum]|uniref:Lactonase, 7-bladed beta-propeller-domain-containing protein n=1 Tax=Achaetomium macrosporum TaxID=79813 RepID=A0AAN7C717_9PEZI|nr:Lactonase, 7-bladed beta-propeller-domain-containing protein [Achaetomium macrosporum]
MRTAYGITLALSASFRLTSAAPRGGSSLLYVTTYPVSDDLGKVLTLKLDGAGLQSVAESDSCGPYPSWLTQAGNILYCVNEAWGGDHGDLASLKIGADLSLAKLSGGTTVGGPVSTIVYGAGGRGLAVADYAGGGINTFNISDPAAIVPLQTEVFPKPPDNRPEPQNQARPHEAVLDPTGNFLVFPDLGADLLRTFRADKKTLALTESKVYEFSRGTGPRHAAFLKSGSKTFLYVVCELANLLQGFSVTYNADNTLSFTQIYNATTHGDSNPVPAGTSAAEITLSPDRKFLTLSSRNEKSLQYTLANGTTVPSDPLITFAINAATGALSHVQTAPAGGINPRHFSFNKDGTRVASALQSDGRIVVFERDVASGKIGKAVAEADVPGMPNFAVFAQ